MERTLSEINKTPDVVGSCIVAEDGILVASDFNSEIDSEVIGALVSSVIRAAKLAIQKMDYGDIRSFMLEAKKIKLFFAKTRVGYLVVITNADANLGLIRVEVKNAVKKLDGLGL